LLSQFVKRTQLTDCAPADLLANRSETQRLQPASSLY